ncbi:helix-turn-helix domain-containing protein [Clostridium chauvoei]|uniref:helix-turn-helix transcriptional regulator n=1 Tax=Clostridium chauvoei TaxID=46867 RepID=UPI001C848115|nr:helix-turn-helix transcriptional regulator [Clostridium chauvoei]MBX7310349.1 helix-turn-helix domain-containing protein [Clostridium chauvoei]MBX7315352.1 helix-turn-helix domain-containing protein [Clostridium chauvoei]MBX7343245.1 helix-turn-helix domain-containing protein [Clostridium chauvoei]
MEILSTGEKIKRSRVYQGITLKELCGDKISISKMSCIENGKIKADTGILSYIAKKLGVDYNYLVQDVHEQIIANLELLRNNLVSEDEISDLIQHNLSYAIDYSYDDLAFELIHRLFNFYVENNKVEKIQLIISQYYDLYQKNNTIENTIAYYRDMAMFFYSIEEYMEAINYYNKIREIIIEKNVEDKAIYAYTSYREGLCYEKLNNIDSAYNCLKEAILNIDSIDDNMDKGDIYHSFATLNIMLNKPEADTYIEKAYEYQKENPMALSVAKGKNGECYFYIGNKEKAIEEIKEGIELFPKDNSKKYVRFLNDCIQTFYNNGEYNLAYELTDTALNLAINTEDIVLIEEAYYLKGMTLQKLDRYREAEVYMNLSLDSLFKFANKEKRYKRYLDMAQMYYKLNETKDALKYFTLAIKMEESK